MRSLASFIVLVGLILALWSASQPAIMGTQVALIGVALILVGLYIKPNQVGG